jgi:Family of unknown function (DUF5335)
MTIEIPKEKWTSFFDDLSRRRFGWETKIEVLSEAVGDQILSDGLPLNGVTFEEKAGRHEIEIAVGDTANNHQTHNISNPTKAAYLDEGDFFGGVIEIEDENKTKTLIKLLNPMPVYVGYDEYEILIASAK